jgi:hypothetical protein
VGEHDWLDRGHGGGEGLQPLIKGSSGRGSDRVSIRGVLRGITPTRKPRRRAKALIGWLLYCATAVGGTAAAFTVRDTLFPSLGAPTNRSVWASSNVDNTLWTEHGSSTSLSSETRILEAAVMEEIVQGQPSSSTDEAAAAAAVTVPTAYVAAQKPNTTVDNRDPGTDRRPGTVDIVDQAPATGPGPGTTVDGKPTDTSTPSTVGEPTSTSTSDPGVTTTSVADGDGSGRHKNKGKGGGDTTTPTVP